MAEDGLGLTEDFWRGTGFTKKDYGAPEGLGQVWDRLATKRCTCGNALVRDSDVLGDGTHTPVGQIIGALLLEERKRDLSRSDVTERSDDALGGGVLACDANEVGVGCGDAGEGRRRRQWRAGDVSYDEDLSNEAA